MNDEGNPFILSDDFAETIRRTSNYYVIVSRDALPNLPYSIEEIYGIRMSGKYGVLKQTYNEFYQIYGADIFQKSMIPDTVVTEDSHAGYQFFETVCGMNGINCISASGKMNTSR